jgi:hypothetical protein
MVIYVIRIALKCHCEYNIEVATKYQGVIDTKSYQSVYLSMLRLGDINTKKTFPGGHPPRPPVSLEPSP